MNKKKYIGIILMAIIIGGAAFFAGVKWESKRSVNQDIQLQRKISESRDPQGDQNVVRAKMMRGQIVEKDDSGILIKTSDGGSKKINFSDQTTIAVFSYGSIKDLKVGDQVTASGKNVEDGSLDAKNVEIRPIN